MEKSFMTSTEIEKEITRTKNEMNKTTSWKRKNDLERHIKKLLRKLHQLSKFEKHYTYYESE